MKNCRKFKAKNNTIKVKNFNKTILLKPWYNIKNELTR